MSHESDLYFEYSTNEKVALEVDAGAAYLFDATGNHLYTFQAPSPSDGDNFGHSMVMLAEDRLAAVASGALASGVASPPAEALANGAVSDSMLPPSSSGGSWPPGISSVIWLR